MEDLISTTRYVTWSLHNKVVMDIKIGTPLNLLLSSISSQVLSFFLQNRAGLRQFLDSFGGAEQPGKITS